MPTQTNSKHGHRCPKCNTDWVKQTKELHQCLNCKHRWCSCGGQIEPTKPINSVIFLQNGWGHCKECLEKFYCKSR